MSMFHELMMRKKEEIMYATIKGTLTENNGVFSGFSNTNYLQTQQTFDVSQTNWEFVIKASKASTGNARLFCINNGNGAMHTIFSLTSFSCTILTTTLTISQNFTADNFYFFKIKRNGNILSLSWSSDGIIYQDEQSAEVTNWGNSGYVFYGRVAGLSTAGFGGSIDLNNSYIKLGSTKYKLQAVVGYTVVGSPTIVDGVVSGFSSANYLLLGANVPYSNNFEMLFKFTTGTIGTAQAIFDGTTHNNGATITLSSNGKLFVSAGNGSWIVDTSGTTTLSANTTYYAKFSYKNSVYKLELSTDNINWNTEISVESSSILSTTYSKSIGYSTRFRSRVFSGSIYMNETYIKINNKLWFNGQQA